MVMFGCCLNLPSSIHSSLPLPSCLGRNLQADCLLRFLLSPFSALGPASCIFSLPSCLPCPVMHMRPFPLGGCLLGGFVFVVFFCIFPGTFWKFYGRRLFRLFVSQLWVDSIQPYLPGEGREGEGGSGTVCCVWRTGVTVTDIVLCLLSLPGKRILPLTKCPLPQTGCLPPPTYLSPPI